MQSYIFHPRGTVFYHLINCLSSKSCPIDMLRKISEIMENMNLRKYDISVNCGKSKKYIYVEHFYENVVFHEVKDCLKPRSNKNELECKNCGCNEFYASKIIEDFDS